MKTPEISVIVPIYNAEQYLAQTIESIINQSFKNIEIILVNDGATDSSPAICEEYAKKDKRIIVANKPNGGLADARNYGIDKASGEYQQSGMELTHLDFSIYFLLVESHFPNRKQSLIHLKYLLQSHLAMGCYLHPLYLNILL